MEKYCSLTVNAANASFKEEKMTAKKIKLTEYAACAG